MPSNRLGKEGGGAILEQLTDRIKRINLDNNDIGDHGVMNLVRWINILNHKC
jgi:hypothetical protein